MLDDKTSWLTGRNDKQDTSRVIDMRSDKTLAIQRLADAAVAFIEYSKQTMNSYGFGAEYDRLGKASACAWMALLDLGFGTPVASPDMLPYIQAEAIRKQELINSKK